MLSRLKKFWEAFSGVEKKLLLIFILTLIAGLIAQAVVERRYTVPVPAFGGSYTEGMVSTPEHINPLLAPANEVDADLSRIVYSGVLKFDPQLNLIPDLAESMPQISPDGKTYTIRLKPDLYWQDGIQLTADDVVFTYTAIENAELRSPLRLSWNRVDVTKIDDHTVKITTRESLAPFIANLTVGIIPKHIWETVSANDFALSKYNLEPVGSGPFQVSEIQRGRDGEIRSMTLTAFRRYYGDGPYLKTLNFKFYATTDDLINAYHARDIQGLGYVPFDRNLFIEPKSSLNQFQLPLPQYQAVFINRAKNPAPLEDVRVRTALAKSVDKQKIISDVFVGQGSEAYGPILPGFLGYHEQIPGADMNIYDPQKSKDLLDQAGWILNPQTGFRQDKLGRTLSLNLATNDFSPNVLVAQALKQMWEGIGVQIVLDIETAGDLEEKIIRPRNYELLLFSENVGADPDPFPFWHSSQLRDPGLNLSTFSNKAADKLLVDARANIPTDQRAAKYKQFQEIFVGDVPAIFIDRSVFVYNLPKTVRGVDLNTISAASERFADINQWYVETKRVKK